MIRTALKRMGREDLIGNAKEHLVPEFNGRLEKGQGRGQGKSYDFHHRIKTKKSMVNSSKKFNAKSKRKAAGAKKKTKGKSNKNSPKHFQ
jgi:hypothetical protein